MESGSVHTMMVKGRYLKHTGKGKSMELKWFRFFGFFSVFRVFRFFRVFKFFRVLRRAKRADSYSPRCLAK